MRVSTRKEGIHGERPSFRSRAARDGGARLGGGALRPRFVVPRSRGQRGPRGREPVARRQQRRGRTRCASSDAGSSSTPRRAAWACARARTATSRATATPTRRRSRATTRRRRSATARRSSTPRTARPATGTASSSGSRRSCARGSTSDLPDGRDDYGSGRRSVMARMPQAPERRRGLAQAEERRGARRRPRSRRSAAAGGASPRRTRSAGLRGDRRPPEDAARGRGLLDARGGGDRAARRTSSTPRARGRAPGVTSNLKTSRRYEEAFRTVFGDAEPSIDRIARAVERYCHSVHSGESSYDRFAAGTGDAHLRGAQRSADWTLSKGGGVRGVPRDGRRPARSSPTTRSTTRGSPGRRSTPAARPRGTAGDLGAAAARRRPRADRAHSRRPRCATSRAAALTCTTGASRRSPTWCGTT